MSAAFCVCVWSKLCYTRSLTHSALPLPSLVLLMSGVPVSASVSVCTDVVVRPPPPLLMTIGELATTLC